eukprot:SAG31_NODE_344_length_17385_cov_58.217575_8_plen_89_part_00
MAAALLAALLVSVGGSAAAAAADSGAESYAEVDAAARAADAACTVEQPNACTLTIQSNTHYPKIGYKDLQESTQAACCAACEADAKCA